MEMGGSSIIEDGAVLLLQQSFNYLALLVCRGVSPGLVSGVEVAK